MIECKKCSRLIKTNKKDDKFVEVSCRWYGTFLCEGAELDNCEGFRK